MGAIRAKADSGYRWLIGKESGWQFGEQGVLDAIIERLPGIPKMLVEFGAGDGVALQLTGQRLIDRGWDAFLAECDEKKQATLTDRLVGTNAAVSKSRMIPGESFGPTDPIGVCVIDTDSDEYRFVGLMNERPWVLCVEHRDEQDSENPRGPDVPKDLGASAPSGFARQANLPAIKAIAEARGYTLVWAGRVNGIYVLSEHAAKIWKDPVTPTGDEPAKLSINPQGNLEGYKTIGGGTGIPAYPLDYADDSIEAIRAVNALESFPIDQCQDVVNEWVRVLKPGGRLRISTVDIGKAAKQITDPTLAIDAERVIYGTQSDPHEFRRSGHDEAGLLVMLQRAGACGMGRWQDEYNDAHRHSLGANIEGYKPTAAIRDAAILRKIRCVQSVPRLCFTDTVVSVGNVVRKLGIDVHTMQGAFWGQCMERGFEAAIKNDAEWILTVDYDTIFSVADVQKLCMIFEANPDVDALAPVQLKRGDDSPILNVANQSKDFGLLRGPLMDATLAHFGLTLIRVSALKKMPHPWFIGVPGDNGRWEDNRLDDDINFWKKFREAGNRLCVAPRVCVGHMQLMITWPDEYLRPIRQHLHDYHENGAPIARRC